MSGRTPDYEITLAPYAAENTDLYAAGSHTIEAIAVDASPSENTTVAGSPGSFINVNLNRNGPRHRSSSGAARVGRARPDSSVGRALPW
jgi:hypothetical protein